MNLTQTQENRPSVCMNGGDRFDGNRHYFLARISSPRSNFLLYDQVGNEAWLGSWYGIEMPVLVKVPADQLKPGTGGGTAGQTGKSVIERFFSQVDSGDIATALTLLNAEALGDAGSQEMWKTSLGAIENAAVTSMQESNKTEWPKDFEQYQVSISLHLKPGSQVLWSEGSNTFWISLTKVNGQWKILEIATGE